MRLPKSSLAQALPIDQSAVCPRMISDVADRLPLFTPQRQGFAGIECRLDHVVKTIPEFENFLRSTPGTTLAHIRSAYAAGKLDKNHHSVSSLQPPKRRNREFRVHVHPVGYPNLPKTEMVSARIQVHSASPSVSAIFLTVLHGASIKLVRQMRV